MDSSSGESGSSGRDKKMHKDILESPKYSDIVFTPQHIKGTVQVQLQSGAGSADGSFNVKYQEWGMKSPSTFILRVNDKVEIHVHAVGKLGSGAAH